MGGKYNKHELWRCYLAHIRQPSGREEFNINVFKECDTLVADKIRVKGHEPI